MLSCLHLKFLTIKCSYALPRATDQVPFISSVSKRIMPITKVVPQRWLPWTKDQEPFRWKMLPHLWPRRLLHIPTITSLEREAGNIYGAVREPEYGILTYIWGKWRISEDPSIHIAGTSWNIPAVDAPVFTPDSFHNVLKTISQDTTSCGSTSHVSIRKTMR